MSDAASVIRPAHLAPLTIEVSCSGGRTFKSVDHVLWSNIPGLAVLTGLNGSGKTQLLELLAYKLTNTLHNQYPDLSYVTVKASDETLGRGSVTYIPSNANLAYDAQLAVSDMRELKRSLYQQLSQSNVGQDLRLGAQRARLEKFLGVERLSQIDQETFAKRLPDDFSFMLSETQATLGVAHVFIGYRLRVMEALEKGVVTRDDVGKKFGPAPWDLINEAFQVAEFPYRITSPMETGILDTYHFRLEDVQSKKRILPSELSSGELMILNLMIWLYNSQNHGNFPKLFLMDEPDAHLHPSMTRQFLAVIKEVLLDRYGVRTILTTHSPSTVALAPEASIFVMSRTAPRIARAASRAEAIGILTSGLVIVSPSTKYVLVEDDTDVDFFSMVRDLLTDYGPGKDKRAISPARSLVFLPASRRTDGARIGGGSSVVTGWVNKFDHAPLSEMIKGVIDGDVSNVSSGRVFALSRHSIENYLLDPFVVFALLMEIGKAPTLPDTMIRLGDEHLIRSLSDAQLTAIVQYVRQQIEPHLADLVAADREVTTVPYTNGRTVELPKWMLKHRGHDLLPVFQKAFGGAGVVSPPRLRNAFQRTRMIPTDLAEILKELQN